MSRYAKSRALLARARQVTPGGAQTASKQASRFPEGAHPAFIERGDGAHVWDADGNRYCDWICGLASITLGHAHPVVKDAVSRQLQDGTIFSLPHRLEAEVAEMLHGAMPWAEQARFVKTGSEATEAAIRVARTATGKDVIVTVEGGYHSWHSWFAASKPVHPGVPKEYEALVQTFRYNDIASLQEALRQAPGNVAAVVMEPMLLEEPRPGFLREVAGACRAFGALLIFDEIVCGFRWAVGGGGEFFGVEPDLACFGKGMANGFPLACLVGPADLMRHAELVSGTFGGDCIALAAAKATMNVFMGEDVIGHVWKIGTDFRDGLSGLIAAAELPARMVGYGVHPALRWDHPQANVLMSLFLQETAAHGVLLHQAGWNVSYSHGEKEVAESLEACKKALEFIKLAMSSGEPEKFLAGKEIQPSRFEPRKEEA